MKTTIGAHGYVWLQIYEQQGKKVNDHLDEALRQVAESGFETWEQGIESPAHAANLKTLLAKYNLKMPTFYLGCILHREDWRERVEEALGKARLALPLGVKIAVCNPNPIEWGKALDKSDEQLKTQAEALQSLSQKLSAEGVQLAYHTHDAEMRCAAREFHHMMQATEVGFCLDTHWVYRGSGNSQVAMHDALKMYGHRLRSLHIRQSQNGIWSETFGEGNIDYRAVAEKLKEMGFNGPIIVEQCYEQGTPQTITPLERHKRSREYMREIFGV